MVAWGAIGSALGNAGNKLGKFFSSGKGSSFLNALGGAGNSGGNSGMSQATSNAITAAILGNMSRMGQGSTTLSPTVGSEGWSLNNQGKQSALTNILGGLGAGYLSATEQPNVYYVTSHLNADGTANVGLGSTINQGYINPEAWATTIGSRYQKFGDNDSTASYNRWKAAQRLSNIGQNLRDKWSNWNAGRKGIASGDFYQTKSTDDRTIV